MSTLPSKADQPTHGEPRIWLARFTELAGMRERLVRALSPDELERARAFTHEKARERFELSRGMLRAVLGECLSREAGELRFGYGEKGKPYLRDDACGLAFNLSHTSAGVALAMTRGPAVGIDIEEVRELSREDLLVDRILAPGERSRYESLAAEARRDWLFRVWVAKEAIGKASGQGIGYAPMSRFEAPLAGDAVDPAWRVLEFAPWPGHRGALALARTEAAEESTHAGAPSLIHWASGSPFSWPWP